MAVRSSLLSLIGSIAVAAAAFLPWLRLGDVGLSGMPDPAGYFVLVLGVAGVFLSVIRLLTRRDTGQWLILVGLAALTTLVVVWRTGPQTVADRAQAHAEALWNLAKLWNDIGKAERAVQATQLLKDRYPSSPWAKL